MVKILIIDDDLHILTALTKILETFIPDSKIITTKSGSAKT